MAGLGDILSQGSILSGGMKISGTKYVSGRTMYRVGAPGAAGVFMSPEQIGREFGIAAVQAITLAVRQRLNNSSQFREVAGAVPAGMRNLPAIWRQTGAIPTSLEGGIFVSAEFGKVMLVLNKAIAATGVLNQLDLSARGNAQLAAIIAGLTDKIRNNAIAIVNKNIYKTRAPREAKADMYALTSLGGGESLSEALAAKGMLADPPSGSLREAIAYGITEEEELGGFTVGIDENILQSRVSPFGRSGDVYWMWVEYGHRINIKGSNSGWIQGRPFWEEILTMARNTVTAFVATIHSSNLSKVLGDVIFAWVTNDYSGNWGESHTSALG